MTSTNGRGATVRGVVWQDCGGPIRRRNEDDVRRRQNISGSAVGASRAEMAVRGKKDPTTGRSLVGHEQGSESAGDPAGDEDYPLGSQPEGDLYGPGVGRERRFVRNVVGLGVGGVRSQAVQARPGLRRQGRMPDPDAERGRRGTTCDRSRSSLRVVRRVGGESHGQVGIRQWMRVMKV